MIFAMIHRSTDEGASNLGLRDVIERWYLSYQSILSPQLLIVIGGRKIPQAFDKCLLNWMHIVETFFKSGI